MDINNPEYQKSLEWGQQAIERMKHYGLNPSPENYAVFYHYFMGANLELKAAVNAILERKPSLSQVECKEIYDSHLGLYAEHRFLQQTSEAVDTELKNVLGAINSAVQGSSHYANTLDSFSGKLTTTTSLEQIREAVLRVLDETKFMATQNQQLQSQLSETTEQLLEMRENLDRAHRELQIDGLTQVGNRKYFDREIVRSMVEAAQGAYPLSLLMIDIDFFKKFNDNYGHLVGDQVLRLVAKTLVENLKGRDVIARYGGEEFCILLPQTMVQDSERVANQLRAHLATKKIRKRSTNEALGIITISIGAAQYLFGEDADSFVARADAALYKAKQTGRNKVVIADIHLNNPTN